MTRPLDPRRDNSRVIKAPTGSDLNAKSWLTEAPLRMLMNNLHPDVAERPEELVVYGGIGRAARDWQSYDTIVETLKRLDDDQTLLVQRSEEHTSELQSLMRISYAVFCLTKKKKKNIHPIHTLNHTRTTQN